MMWRLASGDDSRRKQIDKVDPEWCTVGVVKWLDMGKFSSEVNMQIFILCWIRLRWIYMFTSSKLEILANIALYLYSFPYVNDVAFEAQSPAPFSTTKQTPAHVHNRRSSQSC